MKTLTIVLMLLVSGAAISQQRPPTSLQGVAVRVGTNAPISNVSMELRSANGANLISSTKTDGDGMFVFPNLPGGNYQLSASRDGFMRRELPGGIVLAPAQALANVRVDMTPAGKISGRIVDRGSPAANVSVVARRVGYKEGHQVVTDVLSAVTNDFGDYEIFWLPPGRYYVATTVGSPTEVLINPAGDSGSLYSQQVSVRTVLNRSLRREETEGHATMYFPNSSDWRKALPVDIGPGAEISNINIDSSPLPILHVQGVVHGAAITATGDPVRSSIRLVDSNTGAVIAGQTDATGAFDIPVVVPGSYVLQVRSGAPPPVVLTNATGPVGVAQPVYVPGSARAAVEVVDRDVNGLVLNLQPGLRLSGTIAIEGAAPPNSLNALTLVFREDPWLQGSDFFYRRSGAVQDPASSPFTVSNVQAGSYRVLVAPLQLASPGTLDATLQNATAAMRNAFVKSIRQGERDILHDGLRMDQQASDPLLVVISTNAATAEGRVVNDRQQPMAAVAVALIPEDNSRFRLDHKFTYTDASGKFKLDGLAPGEYRIFAWENVGKGDWQDPEFMRKYEDLGKAIHVDESETKSVGDLVAAPPR